MNIEIDELKRVSLNPGEVILVRSQSRLSAFQKDDIRGTLKKAFPDNEIVIVDGNLDLSIVEKVSA